MKTHSTIETQVRGKRHVFGEIVARAEDQQIRIREPIAKDRYCANGDIKTEAARDGTVADDSEALRCAPVAIESKDAGIRNVEDDSNLAAFDANAGEALAMKLVDGEDTIGKPRANTLLQHQQARAERTAAAPEFVAIKFGHRVVHVEDDLAAKKPEGKRAQHRRVRHSAYDDELVAVREAKLEGLHTGGDKEAHVGAEVTRFAGTAIAPQFQADDVNALVFALLRVLEAEQVYAIAAVGEGLGVALDPRVVDVRGIGDHEYSCH